MIETLRILPYTNMLNLTEVGYLVPSSCFKMYSIEHRCHGNNKSLNITICLKPYIVMSSLTATGLIIPTKYRNILLIIVSLPRKR